jgi:transcriptional regulator with XRE-family HTH domain
MPPETTRELPDYAANLRRLMVRQGWSLAELSLASGIDERTIRGILNGGQRPQNRTLQRLAETLHAPTDELFQDPSVLAHRLFDRATNPVVDEVVVAQPALFRGWTDRDYDALYSRFGVGGALTREGTLAAARAINRQRRVLDQVALIMETHEADLLAALVDTIHQRVCVAVEDMNAEPPQETTPI